MNDIPSAMNLLTKSQSKFYVHSIRNDQIWHLQEKTSIASDPEPFKGFIVEKNKEIVAYFRMRENLTERELVLTEITDVDQLISQAVLKFFKEVGTQRGFDMFSAQISYQEPMTRFLTALGGVERFPAYAWQIRITDSTKIFQKLRPLFETRLALSMYCRLTEKLNFNFRQFTIQLTINDGMITDIQRLETGEFSPIGLNPYVFTQLLLGYKSRHELETTCPDFRIVNSHRHLIDVLFPKLPSYIHSAY